MYLKNDNRIFLIYQTDKQTLIIDTFNKFMNKIVSVSPALDAQSNGFSSNRICQLRMNE